MLVARKVFYVGARNSGFSVLLSPGNAYSLGPASECSVKFIVFLEALPGGRKGGGRGHVCDHRPVYEMGMGLPQPRETLEAGTRFTHQHRSGWGALPKEKPDSRTPGPGLLHPGGRGSPPLLYPPFCHALPLLQKLHLRCLLTIHVTGSSAKERGQRCPTDAADLRLGTHELGLGHVPPLLHSLGAPARALPFSKQASKTPFIGLPRLYSEPPQA